MSVAPGAVEAPLPTPATIVRHELVGLDVRVVDDACADRVGIAGRVVGETTHTLAIERDAPGEASDAPAADVARVPKADATFAFTLPAPDGRTVRVDGERLVARPAERSETEVRPWR